MQETEEFFVQLVRLNNTMKTLFETGNVALFSEMNAAIKEMHRIERTTQSSLIRACGQDLGIIYENFDMIIAVLRTTEDGEIDSGAQTALNKFLHNIDAAVINIASKSELI